MICQKALSNISKTLLRSRRSQPLCSSLTNVLTTLWRAQCAQTLSSLSPASLEPTLHKLTSRSLLEVQGRDTVEFLQGLVTSDVTQLGGDVAVQYAMMLNVQGRVLYDLLLYCQRDKDTSSPRILVECDTSAAEELTRLMRRYKIRKKVEIRPVSEEWNLFAAVGGVGDCQFQHVQGDTVKIPDPRVPAFGWRILHPSHKPDLSLGGLQEKSETEYHKLRYQWGIPEGVRDLPPGNCLPLESNLIYHNGVSFQKGCYIGQELTARTHHTGVTRKRVMPLEFDTDVDDSIEGGANISRDDGKSVGKYRNSVGKYGLGIIRIADVKGQLTVTNKNGEAVAVRTYKPTWWPDNTLQ